MWERFLKAAFFGLGDRDDAVGVRDGPGKNPLLRRRALPYRSEYIEIEDDPFEGANAKKAFQDQRRIARRGEDDIIFEEKRKQRQMGEMHVQEISAQKITDFFRQELLELKISRLKTMLAQFIHAVKMV